MFISTATSNDEFERGSNVAVLPIGSFEQHGAHLPLSTDTLIACAIANKLLETYPNVLLLPPITISCSHEHSTFFGTVSVSAKTLYSVVFDIMNSLEASGIPKMILVNGHGGNYILSNIVQEANVNSRRMALFPRSAEWTEARKSAGLETDNHEDMHGGEAETSILLAVSPEVVGPVSSRVDEIANDRQHLLTVGMSEYTSSGIIGRPTLANAEKGSALLESFAAQFQGFLDIMGVTS